MKYILFVGDGMADLPIRELQNKTVLEYAMHPALDALASAGEIGEALTVPVTVSPGTATSLFSIMGYDVERYFTGRGSLEAAGLGIKLAEGDIALRCNLININGNGFDLAVMGSHSAYGIDGEVGRVIIEWLINEPEFREELQALGIKLVPGMGYRHMAVVKAGFDYNIKEDFDIVPPHDIVGKEIRHYIHPQTNTNRLIWRLMRKSSEILRYCPYNEELRRMGYPEGNCIWLWGAGTTPSLMDMNDRYGIKGAVISAVPVVDGLGRLCGLTPVKVKGATGDKNTDYRGKAIATLDTLLNKDYDFVLLHVAAPDECSHDGDIDGKIDAIKNIDKMTEVLIKGMDDEDYRLMVIANHITSTESRTHDWGSIPYLLFDSRAIRERGISFDEASAKKFGGDVKNATQLLDLLFETGR